jgi:hypothetical protein
MRPEASIPKQNKEEFMEPNYFTNVWKEHTGYDPVIMEKRAKILHVFYSWGLLISFAPVVCSLFPLLYYSDKPNANLYLKISFGLILLAFIGVGISISFSNRSYEWRDRLRKYQLELGFVACYLRISPEIIVKWNHKELQLEAVRGLKAFCGYLEKIEAMPYCDGEAEIRKETTSNLRSKIDGAYKDFKFWKIVKDTGWGTYFKK